MEITMIHGQMHKGSTYNAALKVVQALPDKPSAVHEFFLPEDGTPFCVGCFNCIKRGADKCPHYEKTGRILDAIFASDIIIVDSPTYAFEMTGQLKALFDHLCFMWMSHRPDRRMFGKTAIVVTTAAGSGMGHAARSIANQFLWLGVTRRFTLAVAVNASSWEEVSNEKREEIEKKAAAIGRKIKKKNRIGIKQQMIFEVMRLIQKRNNWSEIDRNHWADNGWLGKERPWRSKTERRTE